MSYVLENWPALENFCLCCPLRPGLVFISIGGLVYAGVFIFFFTPDGSEVLQDWGLPKAYAKPMRYFYGMLGVQLSAVNVLLFIAYRVENDALCEVYIWFSIIFWVLLMTSTIVAATGAIIAGSGVFAVVLVGVVLLLLVPSLYSTIVVANYRMTLP